MQLKTHVAVTYTFSVFVPYDEKTLNKRKGLPSLEADLHPATQAFIRNHDATSFKQAVLAAAKKRGIELNSSDVMYAYEPDGLIVGMVATKRTTKSEDIS